jgi:peptidoglycan biosynthesis protein MviN/MurJ (putative lipid II flippase)
LFAQALIPLFARAFYARHNTVTPVITGLFAMLFNVALSYYFALHPAAADLSLGNLKISFDTSGSVGLALGFTIANIVHGLILFTLLRGRMAKAFSGNFQEITGFDSALIGNLSKIIISSLAMGVTGYAFIYLLAPLVDTRTGYGILIQAGLSAALAVAAYLLVGLRFRLAPALSLVRALNKLARKGGGAGPAQAQPKQR